MSAHGRKGAFVGVVDGVLVGECGRSAVGRSVFMVVMWIGGGLAIVAFIGAVTTGLKLEVAAPNTGTVAVEANEITGAGKARLKRGNGPSAVKVAGGDMWSGEARGGVIGA